MFFRSGRRVTKSSVASVSGSMASGEPASHKAQSLPPTLCTEVLAGLASSAEPMRARGSPVVPKPGISMAPASLSCRRLRVSAKRAAKVA
ncbi:hypothetical protein D3C73_1100010 [compost metagenome]